MLHKNMRNVHFCPNTKPLGENRFSGGRGSRRYVFRPLREPDFFFLSAEGDRTSYHFNTETDLERAVPGFRGDFFAVRG